ncbi:hypothetical protein [Mycolicibacterium poriferae]|uniref:hypothetical protein n=1 Tax=Mycolicibacterium poriferae TaxID=39694 RepID=UPI0024BAFD77|nr:hypothetical protein [Mycolicibacterium poriferae]
MTLYPRDEMAAIQRRLASGISTIRDNRRLTNHGKRTEMAKLVKTARKQRDDLKTKYLTDREARRERLQRRIFGVDGDMTREQLAIFRDSRDRAKRIETPEDAQTELEFAHRYGDTWMVKAIALRAVEQGWREVFSTYQQHAPETTRADLDALADIPSGPRTNAMDVAVFKLSEPDELRAYRGDTDIDRLAAESTETIPTGGMRYEGVPMP